VRPRTALLTWAVMLVLAAVLVARAPVSADLSAFLPRSPSPAQQVLVDQLREGVVSRLLLVGIEGAPVARLAALSEDLRGRLSRDPAIVYVSNGAPALLEADGGFLLEHRYTLSAGVTPERFGAAGLRDALERNLELLASPTSLLLAQMLPADPTGEFPALLEWLRGEAQPHKREGVWFSADASRALLIAQTRAAGFDLDAQQAAIASVRAAFAQLGPEAAAARLLLSGPAVFAVQARASIKEDAVRLTGIAVGLIAVLLLLAFRSARVLGLTLLPVASGTIVGAAAVSLGFDTLHSVILGFGVTLIGEAVDYAIYLFTHMGAAQFGERALHRLWPTLVIGVLTSVIGFATLAVSGFPGLMQLGVFSIVGLVTAALVTRFALPPLVPSRFAVRKIDAAAAPVLALARLGRRLRWPLLVMLALGLGWLAWRGELMWDDDLERLSPVAAADKALDRSLRRDLAAPDVRQLVVVAGASADAALAGAERVGEQLQALQEAGAIAGFDSPARYLPSAVTQRARHAALQDPDSLRRNLVEAARGLPFRADAFDPFLAQAEQTRQRGLLTRADLEGTGFALKVDALLQQRPDGWVAVMPLRGVAQEAAVAAALAELGDTDAVLLDLKSESERLFSEYRVRTLQFSLMGAGAIGLLLLASLRSARRTFEVMAPLAAAITTVCVTLAVMGIALTLFHLVGLLLVVAVGSNYSLFFERDSLAASDARRTIAAVVLCNLSTVIGFGVLAFSRTPVLAAIGTTVALGAFLALVFAALLSVPMERRLFGS
jgi:predicted exporter